MEYNYKNCNEEASVILIGRLSGAIPELNVDMPRQLEIKRLIDEVLYNYEVTSKETSLVASDIDQKAGLYLACKKLEGLSCGTLYNYTLELKNLSLFFNKPVGTINSMDIRMYMACISENRAESTINTKMTPIRDFFQWLQNEEYIVANPCKKVKAVKEPHRERTPLSNEQIELIRDSLSDRRDKGVLEFLLASGCRVGELVGIKINDIDWRYMSLNVIGKGNKERKVYFNERAKLSLLKYLETRKGNSEYLISSEKYPYGKVTTRSIQRIIKKIELNSNVGVKLYPHIFRHSFATRALASGMTLDVLQTLLGHEDVGTTTIYAKVKDSNVEYMYRRISA